MHYEEFNFIGVTSTILKTINSGYLSFYLDYAKDILYTYDENSIERQNIIYTLEKSFELLVFSLYPIIPVFKYSVIRR